MRLSKPALDPVPLPRRLKLKTTILAATAEPRKKADLGLELDPAELNAATDTSLDVALQTPMLQQPNCLVAVIATSKQLWPHKASPLTS